MKKQLLTLLAGSIMGPLVLAQDTTSDEEEVYELSPFVVESADQQGYMATNTLAGTRLNTKLDEVGAAVSVYTEEFLEDIDANSVEDILTYTTSSEGGGIGGNFASVRANDGGHDGTQGPESSDEVRGNPSGINRIRALSPATRTRDFIESTVPSDSYNFSNLTISRGPNAILAGIGSAGGVIDAALRQAQFNDSTRLVYRYGEHNSHRGEIHYNKELIDSRLAFRIDAMYEDQNFRQHPSYEEDQRVYGAVKWNIRENNPNSFLGRTTLRANVEVGSIEGVPPDILTPLMSTQSWFEGIDPRDGEPWAAPKWRTNGALRRSYDEGGYQDGNGTVIPNSNWGLVYANEGSLDATMNLSGANASIQGHQGVVPAGNLGPGGYLRGTGDRNRNRAGFTRTRLQNREVFDFYNELLTGAFDFRKQSFDATDIRLEQLFLNGKAGVEVAYNLMNFRRFRDIPIQGEAELYIDTTEYLSIRGEAWNTDNSSPAADWLIENPNFGRPFVISRDAFRDQFNYDEGETFQATAFVKHDFTDSDSLLGYLLGRHTLSGLYFDTSQFTRNETYGSTWDPAGELDFVSSLAAQPGDFRAQVNAHFYLGESQVGAASEDDIRFNAISTGRPEFGQTYTLRAYDPALKQFVTGTTQPLRILDNYREAQEDIESYALALQSHWLADHLITLVGWRNDTSNTFTSSELDRLPDGNLDTSTSELLPSSTQSEDSWTKSVVLKFPEQLFFELPFDSDLRFYWNTSENFDPVGQRRNIWNENVGSPRAETEEYGVMLSSAGGKLSVRVNWFETTIKGAAVGGVPNVYGYTNTMITRMVGAHLAGLDPQEPASDPNDPDGLEHSNGPNSFTSFEEVARAFFDTIPEQLAVNIGEEFNFNPRFLGTGDTLSWEADNVTNLRSLSDVVSKGTEIEIVWNPTRSWRIAINASQNEAVKDNVAVEELKYVDEWLNNANTMFNGELVNMVRNPGQNNGSWVQQYMNETVFETRSENALSGTANPEIREWRVNVVTRYEFRDGPLEGFRIGGALRWQDEVGIGYPLITNEEGLEVADIANAYFGPEELYVDLNVGYRRKFKAFGENIDWTISLNVRNITGQEDIIPIVANEDGSWGTVRIPPERTWRITNTFRW
jgi:hypothetical protein